MSREDDRSEERDRRERRGRERRQESRRPPRVLRLAAAAGLLVVLVSVGALGLAVVFGGLAPGGIDVPQAAFSIEYDPGADSVSVEHVEGETFDRDNSGRLYVAVNGTSRAALVLPVAPGDGVTVENVSAGQPVTVVWVAPDGDERVLERRVVGEDGSADGSADAQVGGRSVHDG